MSFWRGSSPLDQPKEDDAADVLFFNPVVEKSVLEISWSDCPRGCPGSRRRVAFRQEPPLWQCEENRTPHACLVALGLLLLRDLLWPFGAPPQSHRAQLRNLLSTFPILLAFWACWVFVLVGARQAAAARARHSRTALRGTNAPSEDSRTALLAAEDEGQTERNSRRCSACRPVANPGLQNPIVAERIRQLDERTRICTRGEWEDEVLPELLREKGRESGPRPECDVTSCCICLSDIARDARVRGLACGHLFHLQCVAQWFMRDSTFSLCCPLCRLPLSKQQRILSAPSSPSASAGEPAARAPEATQEEVAAL